MSSRLQLWFRTVAATGRHSSIQADMIWNGHTGLVEYSRARLWFYISQINDRTLSMTRLAARSTVYGPVVTCLQGLCQKATQDSAIQQLSDIVNIAYILRHIWNGLRGDREHVRILRSINLLGRLRAAYECFKSAALTFDEFTNMEIKAVVLQQPMEINVAVFQKHLQRLARDFCLPKRLLKSNPARRYIAPSRLFVHAEMQILASLAENADSDRRSHRYIGISKKPCYLCSQMLQNYTKVSIVGTRQPNFKARQSHGKIYPLWTVSRNDIVPHVARLAMATALTCTYREMQQRLQRNPALEAAIAESSAGITASIASRIADTTKQYLAAQRPRTSPEMSKASEEPIVLGRKIKSVRAVLLPTDGSESRLIPVTFCSLTDPAACKLRENQRECVPDFRDWWGECQFDRRYRILTIENQPNKEWDGTYRIYWNENNELPENEHIKNLLGLEKIDAIRRFWYGDTFLTKYSEHPQTFAFDVHNVPPSFLHSGIIEEVLRNMWENKWLEEELTRDRSFLEQLEKLEADKDIILQRM
jgi:hypothetical protein